MYLSNLDARNVKVKGANQETGLGNRGRPKVLNGDPQERVFKLVRPYFT